MKQSIQISAVDLAMYAITSEEDLRIEGDNSTIRLKYDQSSRLVTVSIDGKEPRLIDPAELPKVINEALPAASIKCNAGERLVMWKLLMECVDSEDSETIAKSSLKAYRIARIICPR